MADLLSRSVLLLNTNVATTLLQRIADNQATCPELAQLRTRFPDRFRIESTNKISLVCDISKNCRIFVPEPLRVDIFQQIHSLDHPGVRQTRINIAKGFMWPKMDKSVQAMVKACLACQKAKVSTYDERPLQPFSLPNERFDHIHLDFVGPLPPAKGGFKYMLTIIDRYSRYPLAVPVVSPTAGTLIQQFLNRWVAYFGLPLVVTTDQGSAFTAKAFKDFLLKYNITHNVTTTYHPQANGLVERFHRRLKESLTALNERDWTKSLPWTLLGIRNAKGPDISYSPNEALYGINIRVPNSIELAFPTVPVKEF